MCASYAWHDICAVAHGSMLTVDGRRWKSFGRATIETRRDMRGDVYAHDGICVTRYETGQGKVREKIRFVDGRRRMMKGGVVGINRTMVRTWEVADQVITNWAIERGVDEVAVRSWLVVDEDYSDGVVFTRGQIRRECESALKLQRRYEAIVDVVRVTCHTTGIFNEDKVRHIARSVALNAEVMLKVK